MNTGKAPVTLDFSRYAERTSPFCRLSGPLRSRQHEPLRRVAGEGQAMIRRWHGRRCYDGWILRYYWLATSDRTHGIGTWVPYCDWLDAMGRYQ